MPDLVTRGGKGSILTSQEMDDNLLLLQNGYPRVTIPVGGTLQKWKCNVLSGLASDYKWPTDGVNGDKLEIITSGISTASQVRRVGFMRLDTATAVPVKFECTDGPNWNFLTSLATYMGKQFKALQGYPIALAPAKGEATAAAGNLFLRSDNRVVNLDGDSVYSVFGPTPASDGRFANSITFVVNKAGTGRLQLLDGTPLVQFDQAAPQGFKVYLKDDESGMDFIYDKVSNYTGVVDTVTRQSDQFGPELNTRVYMEWPLTLTLPPPVKDTDFIEVLITPGAIGGSIADGVSSMAVDIAPGQPVRFVQVVPGIWYNAGATKVSEFFPSGGGSAPAVLPPHPFLFMGA